MKIEKKNPVKNTEAETGTIQLKDKPRKIRQGHRNTLGK